MNASRFQYAGRIAALFATGALAQPAPAPVSDAPDGKALYAKNCAACHQVDGRGIPGAFPPLAGSQVLVGPPADVAEVLLKGRGGMPDFSASLDDAEIAQVLSYARASWGNGAAPLDGPVIAARRAELQIGPPVRSRFGNRH